MVLQASACLDTVPRPSSMTRLDKVPWPKACLDMVTRRTACLDTMPRPNANKCLCKMPQPNACLDTVPQPSAKTCQDEVP